MSPFMVHFVSYCCELLVAVLALIRFVSSVGSQVHYQVALFRKNLIAPFEFAFEYVLESMGGPNMDLKS